MIVLDLHGLKIDTDPDDVDGEVLTVQMGDEFVALTRSEATKTATLILSLLGDAPEGMLLVPIADIDALCWAASDVYHLDARTNHSAAVVRLHALADAARPDPDAELIERLAEALWRQQRSNICDWSWPRACGDPQEWRELASIAIKATREHDAGGDA